MSLDSLWPQIWKHTHRSSGPEKYHVFLYSLWPHIREHTHRNLGPVAFYYTAVELEKNVTDRQKTENRQTDRQTDRQRTDKTITVATLIPWIAGLSGPTV